MFEWLGRLISLLILMSCLFIPYVITLEHGRSAEINKKKKQEKTTQTRVSEDRKSRSHYLLTAVVRTTYMEGSVLKKY